MAQLSQLLLFDPDPSGLDTLSYGFEKEGCSVTATSDVAKARDLIQSASPALVIVHFRDAEQLGLDFLRATTSNPRTRNIPCVAIGRHEFRAAALGAGAFVFLAVPLFVRDVLGACRLVAAASVPGSKPSPDTELSLQMADVDGVYFLVRSMAVTGRSTAIELHHGARRGDLRFIDGTLTSAQVGSVQGLPALHQMLLWQTASLKFRFKNVVRRGSQLSMKSSDVIEECDRFLRDFAHEVKDLGFMQTVYRSKASSAAPSEAVPSEVVPVLKLFDGQNTLGQVLETSPFRIFDTLKMIKRLAASGTISAITPLTPVMHELGPTISGPAALDYWFQRQPSNLGLGAEVGVGRRAEALRAAAKQAAATATASPGAGRPSSPFVAVVGSPLSGSGIPVVNREVPLRARTATKKNVVEPTTPAPDAAEDIVTPPPVIVATAPKAAAPRTPAPLVPAVPTAAAATLPPAAVPATPPAVPVAPPDRPAAAVKTGEIKTIPPSGRVTGTVPVAGSPTVLVDLHPVPLASPEPPPVTAHMAAQAAPPSVIIAPLTPGPTLTAPRPRQPTPPTGLVEGMNKRPQSDNFNALEADFFDREADLYKRESVDNFDDLDKGHKSNGRSRKR